MKIFRILIGCLVIISGVSALFTPAKTFLSLAWIIGIMLMIHGLSNAISYFTERKTKQHNILFFINGILTFIIGMVLLSNAFIYVFTELILIYMFAGWLVITSILQIKIAMDQKKSGKKWMAVLFAGLLSLVLGVYSFFNPGLLALSIGVLMGMWFISIGIGILTFTSTEPE